MKKIFLLAISILWINPSFGHASTANFQQAIQKNRASTDTLILYPKKVRNATLVVLQYPKILLQIAAIQSKSSSAFKNLISSYPRKTQEQIWELIKYPKLVTSLAAGDKKSLNDYPKEIHPIAEELIAKNPELLKKIDAIDDQPNQDFLNLIQGLPSSAQSAFQMLLRYSDVLFALSKNLNLSSQPSAEQLNKKIQDLTTRLQQANNPSPSQMAVSPGDDPEVLAELQKAENSFNKENNYEINQNPEPKGAAQMNIAFDPYPFATGYAGFYTYPYWFGWPVWFDF